MNRHITHYLFCGFAILIFSVVAHSQTDTPTPDDEPDFIVPARPGVSNPAEFQRPGVLQIEMGYNSNFHSKGNFSDQQDMPIAVRFAISRRILIELDTDTPYSLKDQTGQRNSGAGDTQLGIQAVLRHENSTHPGMAFAYYIKLPTADANRGLGSGRVDHNFIGLISKTIGKTTIDLNVIYLLAGRMSGPGHASSGGAALGFSYNVTKKFTIESEISGSSRNDGQQGAIYAIGGVSYQITRRMVIDGGVRAGLTSQAPRVGFFTGITIGIADLYKKRH